MMTKKELNSTHQRTTELVWAINALSPNGCDAYHVFCEPGECAIKIRKDAAILAYQLCHVLTITGVTLEAFEYAGGEPGYIFFKVCKSVPANEVAVR